MHFNIKVEGSLVYFAGYLDYPCLSCNNSAEAFTIRLLSFKLLNMGLISFLPFTGTLSEDTKSGVLVSRDPASQRRSALSAPGTPIAVEQERRSVRRAVPMGEKAPATFRGPRAVSPQNQRACLVPSPWNVSNEIVSDSSLEMAQPKVYFKIALKDFCPIFGRLTSRLRLCFLHH